MGRRIFLSLVVLGLTLSLLAPSVARAFSTEVYLTSDPTGAEVYLDGKRVGVTPLTVRIEGVARDHKLELHSSGCQSVVKSIYNIHPLYISGCYPAVATDMLIDEELLEDRKLHIVLQKM